MSNKEKVVALLKSIETGSKEPSRVINAGKYVQHNLLAPDGLEGFLATLDALPPNSAKVNTVRVFQDGDFVFSHVDYMLYGPKISLDIKRFEDGKIVEHWDNMQETAGPNPSGHTMIDGATEIKDLDKTEANKILIRSLLEDILVRGKMEKLADYFNGGNYIQHNPFMGDNLSGLQKAFDEWAQQGITIKYHTIHKVLGEYILGEIFEVEYNGASEIFRITPDNFRQKLSCTRKDLYQWMNNRCGLVNPDNECRCHKKTKGFIAMGWIDPDKMIWQPEYKQKIYELSRHKTDELTSAWEDIYANLYKEHPFKTYDTAKALVEKILGNESVSGS